MKINDNERYGENVSPMDLCQWFSGQYFGPWLKREIQYQLNKIFQRLCQNVENISKNIIIPFFKE